MCTTFIKTNVHSPFIHFHFGATTAAKEPSEGQVEADRGAQDDDDNGDEEEGDDEEEEGDDEEEEGDDDDGEQQQQEEQEQEQEEQGEGSEGDDANAKARDVEPSADNLTTIPAKQLARFVFVNADKDGNGWLSRNELKVFLKGNQHIKAHVLDRGNQQWKVCA